MPISDENVNAAAPLPDALKPLMRDRHWVLWRWEAKANGDGRTKVPYQALVPQFKASSTSYMTWANYAEACAAAGEADGLGYVLTDDPCAGYAIAAFDLDGCRDATTGKIAPWARDIVTKANAYCEVTPSQTGLRVLGLTADDSAKVHILRKGPNHGFTRASEGIEIYRHCERYIAMTGDQVGDCAELPNIDAVINEYVERYGGKAGSTNDEFDWNKSDKDEFNPFDEGAAIAHLSNKKHSEDRSAGAFWFMKLAKKRGYTPEKLVALMLDNPTTLIMGHYDGGDSAVSEEKVRADVRRAFTKKDAAQPKISAEQVFRIPDNSMEADASAPRVIQVRGGALPHVVNEAEAALIEQETGIFQRGNMIVRPTISQIEVADQKSDKGTRLVQVKLPGMIKHMTAAADFQKFSKQSDAWLSIDCPQPVAAAYLEAEGEWKLRNLIGVVNSPTLRADGTILDRPGYDRATGLLYSPRAMKFPMVPAKPSQEDARAALSLLKRLIATFPFTSDASRSVALSGMLTAMVRRSLATSPLHGFTAPVAGSGKSKLVDLAALLATGSLAPVIAQGRSEEETEKRLASALIAGDAVISLDNCTEPLAGDLLCQALTQQVLRPRILGQSRNAEVLANAAMFATGNNLSVAGDMTRRVLRCEIDPKVERPELREFASDPVNVLRKSRGAYVVAALTVLRAFILADRPTMGLKPLGGFDEWSCLVRNSLVWLGEADPCDTMEAVRAGDPEREQLAVVVHNWHEVLGDRRVTVKQIIAEANKTVPGKREAREGLSDAFMGMAAIGAQHDRGIDPLRLAKYLSKMKGRTVDGHRIVQEGGSHGIRLWQLQSQRA
jgi:hypothetical protein